MRRNGFFCVPVMTLLLFACMGQSAAQSLKTTHKTKESEYYKKQMLQLQEAIRQNFYNPAAGYYKERVHREKNSNAYSYLWGLCGMLQAGNEIAETTGNAEVFQRVWRAVAGYYDTADPAPGYDSYIVKLGGGDRFYDDNQWIGLALMDAYFRTGKRSYLEKAQEIYRFMMTGYDTVSGGGLYWKEGDHRSKNTCSNGPGILLALKIYEATDDTAFLLTALSLYKWVNKTLQAPSGLYYDNINLTKHRIGKARYSYNTGTMLEANVYLYQLTKKNEYLEKARAIADSSVSYFYGTGQFRDGYWFNAVMLRAYQRLHKVMPSEKYMTAFTRCVNYALEHDRNANGLMSRNERGDLVAQSGMLEILARLSGSDPFRFAFVSDTHVGSGTGAADLRRTVADINKDPRLDFVVITGDITEFGADEELKLAKQILDSLNKPWYIIPGNHDMNWSESGGNSFRTVFGGETFAFHAGEYMFIGTNSGPNMRMGPGQVPRENIVWLDSVLHHLPQPDQRIIYLNHYPQDNSLNNWYEILDSLKQHNVQVILCGHGHRNKSFDFEGIPGVMGRSNLRAKDSVGGYNIVTIRNDSMYFSERNPGLQTQIPWDTVYLYNHHFENDTAHYPRPDYSVNAQYPQVKVTWQLQDNSDIGSGMAVEGKYLVYDNTNGDVVALNKDSGEKIWTFHTGGKIYSTPCIDGNFVAVGSTDQYVYGLNLKSGRQIWKYKTLKPVVASPVIDRGKVFIGGSDGHFRALNEKTGKLVWDYDSVRNFVETRPLIYKGTLYFGSWGDTFYALDEQSGALRWKWHNPVPNRMYSAASCIPAGAHGRVFIVAPDRYMTAFDAETGAVVWRYRDPEHRARESMGLSADSSLVFIKNMEGEVWGVSTTADKKEVDWKADVAMGYDICPTPIVEYDHIVFAPSHSGTVYAIDRGSAKLLWAHKIDNALVNVILPLGNRKIAVSTMDGRIVCLSY